MASPRKGWSDYAQLNLQDGTPEQLPPITIKIPAVVYARMYKRIFKQQERPRPAIIMLSQLRKDFYARITASRHSSTTRDN